MTSQAERIKAFKLAQHARLQKQDEEEQWISSEELCTEGSSDEETHTSSSSKTSHRKQKRNPRTEKRGISPLAQPPKVVETESTSTYQRDSKYLLPEMQSYPTVERQSTSGIYQSETLNVKTDDLKLVDTKVEELDLASNQARSSKACSSSLESEETEDEDAEIEKMIQWRPKRGSIKLPDFPEGEMDKVATLQHDIFEVDAFYTEMVAKINFLKRKPCKVRYTDTDSCKMENLISTLERRKKDPTVIKLLQKISQLDLEISEKNEKFEAIKKERLLAQEEMCNAINDTGSSPALSKSSQIFLHLCNFEKADDEKEKDNKDNDVNNKSSDQPSQKLKKTEKSDKNFITKNIKLAKDRSMAFSLLTDEEKFKLDSLLADMTDSEEYSVEEIDNDAITEEKTIKKKPKKEQGAKTKDGSSSTNHFKLEDSDMGSLDDLDCKLKEILKVYDENGDVQQALFSRSDDEDLLETADNEGKYWKHHQLEKRLEVIEKDLAVITARDEEERKKLEKRNEDSGDENDEEDDGDDNDCEEKE